MVVKKDSPLTQRSLLGYFKPKSTPSNTTENTSSPSLPVKRKNETDTAQEQNATPARSRRRVTAEKPKATTEMDVDDQEKKDGYDERAEDAAPLFPEGFSYTPVDDSAPRTKVVEDTSTSAPKDCQTGELSALAKLSIGSTMSRFAYSAIKTSDAEAVMETDEVKDQDSKDDTEQARRRERFRNKLGNFEAQSPTPGEAVTESLSPSTQRKRRQVIEESDEDNDHEQDSSYAPSKSPSKTSGQKATTTASSTSRTPSKKTKSPYTPLEKQYLEIKEQYPDALLCIEVGYKFRFFGHDAEIASKELSIAHFMDHNFYTASIPTHRLNVHVRRLVHAGYKVGVVKQMETAALKLSGDNKSAPFTRKLTNLYTKATFIESLDQDEEALQGNYGSGDSTSSQYIMCVYEQPLGGTGADEKVKLAIIAVQPATGDIIYDEFVDGHFRNELETRLLHIQPTELIVPVQHMSKATEKLSGHLTISSSQRRAGGSSIIRGQDDVRIERTNGFVKYDKAFSLVSEFYSNSVKQEREVKGTKHKSGPPSRGPTPMEALLNTVLGLSKNLMITLAAIITHLTDFGLARIFRLSKYFECFTSRSHMLLNGNTIANLEIYRNQTDWTGRGSLFSILDHTVTGFGKRLLKKWVGKPLVNRHALQERVDAVEEILTLSGKNEYLEGVRTVLKGIMDLEKGICRVHYGKSSPKEFVAILQTFVRVAQVVPESVLPMDKGQTPDFGFTSPILTKLVGSLPLVLEDVRYFLESLDVHAANRNDKLLMFRTEILEEKWPEVIQHRN
ncbi:Mismatch repair protein msh3, partial [Podila epigama]